MTERVCRYCGCTQDHACVNDVDGPCWWVDDDLCSHCQTAIAALEAKIRVAHDVESQVVMLELRHAEQLQTMLTHLCASPPSVEVIEQAAIAGWDAAIAALTADDT